MRYNYEKVKPPKGICDLPRYLKELLGGFFSRLTYIFGLVWHTGHWILFFMSFVAIFQGVMPVVGSLIMKNILNEMQNVVTLRENGGDAVFWGSAVMVLIFSLFAYRLISQLVSNLSGSVTRVAGEKVVRQVKVQIMEKARELDLASFDMPGFYEKLENANREAGVRPISIINSTFSIISKLIELVSYIVVLAAAPDMWWAVLVIIAVSVPSAVINFIYRRKNFNYMRHRSKDRRQMNYYASVMVDKDLVKEVRMFDLSDTFIGRFKDVFERYYAGMRRLIVQESVLHVVIAFISVGTNCLFYIMIAMLFFDRRIMIGDYSLYTGAIGSITTAVNTLITTSADIYEGTLFIDNLISFLELIHNELSDLCGCNFI